MLWGIHIIEDFSAVEISEKTNKLILLMTNIKVIKKREWVLKHENNVRNDPYKVV